MPIPAYIFTGIAGVKKRKTLEHFRKYLLPGVPEKDLEFLIPIVELARLIRAEVEGDLFDLYRTYDDRLKKFRTRIDKFTSKEYANIRCVFIHTHLTHFITGHFRSWVGSSNYERLFDGLDVKRIINLIDNVHVCQYQVAEDGYPFTLDQLITWRDNELMTTEILAGLLFKDGSEFDTSKVVAVNHCLATLESLLFSPSKCQVYMAFPISKLRDLLGLGTTFLDAPINQIHQALGGQKNAGEAADQLEANNRRLLVEALAREYAEKPADFVYSDLQQQILHFRRFFTSEFIAYDPSTIDERPLIEKLNSDPRSNPLKITPADMWPLICEPPNRIAGRDVLVEKNEIEIQAEQVKELVVPVISDRAKQSTSIDRQVRSRDFRLIEQSDALVAYRPTLGGRWSGAVRHEIEHAYRHLRKPFYVIKDKHDGKLDEGISFGWEYGRQYWGEYDLSTEKSRLRAFEEARDKLLTSIADLQRD